MNVCFGFIGLNEENYREFRSVWREDFTVSKRIIPGGLAVNDNQR